MRSGVVEQRKCPEKPPHMNGEHENLWRFMEYLSDELRDVRADLRENRKLTTTLFVILFISIMAAGGSIIGVLLSGAIK